MAREPGEIDRYRDVPNKHVGRNFHLAWVATLSFRWSMLESLY